VDGDFDYQIYWSNIVDFFENAPGPAARGRVNELLEWWTRWVMTSSVGLLLTRALCRKVFGKNHRQDLTPDVVSRMSVSALATQRQEKEDAVFDSD
jgi:hypothetical protein